MNQILGKYLKQIQTEQLSSIGKGLSKIYKGSSKVLHQTGKLSGKLKMTDLQKYLLKHRDATDNISKILKNNPTPENIKAALIRVAYKTGATIIIGLIILHAYKKYVRNWSAAGRYCRGTTGSQRTACLRRYKIKILIERVKHLEENKKYCVKSKNPKKCKLKIEEEIKKIKERIHVLQTIEERKKGIK